MSLGCHPIPGVHGRDIQNPAESLLGCGEEEESTAGTAPCCRERTASAGLLRGAKIS